MIGLYIAYYIVSITSSVGCWYFRRFKIQDYQYNKNLRTKRRFMIIWSYLMVILQAQLFAAHKILLYPTENHWVISSAFIFIVAYIFLLDIVESPKRR